MDENIIHLFRNLASHCVNEIDEIKKKKCISSLTNIAFDAIWHGQCTDESSSSEWRSQILIEDVAYELINSDKEEIGEELLKNINIVSNGEFTATDDILKFLWLCRKPSDKHLSHRYLFSFSGTDYFYKPTEPFKYNDNIIKPLSILKSSKENILTPSNNILNSFIKQPVLKLPDVKPNPKNATDNENAGAQDRTSSRFSDYTLSEFHLSVLEEPIPRKVKNKGLIKKLYKNRENPEPKENSAAIDERMTYKLTRLDILSEISMRDFVLNSKYVMCGVSTKTMRFNKKLSIFILQEGLSVPGITPDALEEYAKPVLNIGASYKTLHQTTEKYLKENLTQCGIIFKAFWESVQFLLQKHCKDVIEISLDTSLFNLYGWATQKCELFVALNEIYSLLEPLKDMPLGGQILNEIFNYCESIIDDEIRIEILKILTECSFVYIQKLLENWLFYGEINDKYQQDFCIALNEELCGRFDRSQYLCFTLNPKNIPFFLNDIVENVLMCGKMHYLLRLFDSNNKFSSMLLSKRYPSLTLCLNDSELIQLQSNFNEYFKLVISECGEPVTMSQIKEEERLKQAKWDEKITKMQQELNERRNQDRLDKIESLRLQRIKQFFGVKKEMEKQNQALEQLMSTEAEESAKNKVIEEEKARIKDFFEEAIAQVEATEQEALNQLESLQNETENNNNNCPLLLDEEGNMVLNQGDSEGDIVCVNNEVNRNISVVSTEDIINANELFIERKTTAEMNKRKCMEPSTEVFEVKSRKTTSDAERIRNKVLGSEYNILSTEEDVQALPILNRKLTTEAAKNRDKVLGTEFGIIDSSVNKNLEEKLPESTKTLKEDCKPPEFEENTEQKDQSLKDKDNNPTELKDQFINKKDISQKEKAQIDYSAVINQVLNTDVNSKFLVSFDDGLRRKLNLPKNTDTYTLKKYFNQSLKICVKVEEKLVNAYVLQQLFIQENLLSHLRSLRSYFFLHDGEFGHNLTSNLFLHLSKCTDTWQFFDKTALNNIVNDALLYSTTKENAENVSFQVFSMPSELQHESRHVLQPFQLSYAIKWPLNIIFTDKVLIKYRQVFHFLVNLKRAHWTLSETFLHLKTLVKEFGENSRILTNSPHYHKFMIYRHAITLYLVLLEEHVYMNGTEQAWSSFYQDLEKSKNLEDLYRKHVAYIKDVQRRCFLSKNSANLLELIYILTELGVQFYNKIKSASWQRVGSAYCHPNYNDIKEIFNKFCTATENFHVLLEKAVQRSGGEMKIHLYLVQQINMKFSI